MTALSATQTLSGSIGYTAAMDSTSGRHLEQQSSESLMLAYASGNTAAFTQLYNLHKGPLFRFLLRQGIKSSQADEMFQEIWLNVIKARKVYQSTARFQTWLYTIARNRIIDEFRKQGKMQTSELLEQDTVDTTASTPEDGMDKDRKQQQILASVAALPFAQREAFLLKHEAGMNNADIAQITETNQETVKSRLRYAINQLKKQLGGSL